MSLTVTRIENRKIYTFDCVIEKETEKAVSVRCPEITGSQRSFWLPKSLIQIGDEKETADLWSQNEITQTAITAPGWKWNQV